MRDALFFTLPHNVQVQIFSFLLLADPRDVYWKNGHHRNLLVAHVRGEPLCQGDTFIVKLRDKGTVSLAREIRTYTCNGCGQQRCFWESCRDRRTCSVQYEMREIKVGNLQQALLELGLAGGGGGS